MDRENLWPKFIWQSEIYIGVVGVSADAFILMIDDLEITSTITNNKEILAPDANIYPNPANNSLNLETLFKQ